MDLLKAVKYESDETIEKMLGDELPQKLDWLDYEILVKAFEYGRIKVVRVLLNKNCRVNKNDNEEKASTTPLHYAVKWDNLELVSELLKKDASINSIDPDGNSPLHLAFIRCNDEIIKKLVCSIEENENYENKTNRYGLSHLHIVCSRQNSSNIIKDYHKSIPQDFNNKVDSASPKWKGFTALHFAVKFHSIASIKTLLEVNRTLIDEKNDQGKTALEMAQNHLKEYDEISYLLKSNNNLAMRRSIFRTRLHFAFYHNALEDNSSVIESLYKKAKGEENFLDSHDENGLSYLHVAVSVGDLKFVEKFLKHRKEDVNSEICLNSQGFSNYAPLHFAVKYGQDEIVQLLIKRGADVNKISSGGTALYIACELGNCKIIDLLLKSDADINAVRPADGKTPLQALVQFFANNCKSNDKTLLLECIEELIRLVADVNVKDKFHRTALYQNPKGLFIDGFDQCIDILLKYGADVNSGGSFMIEDNYDIEKYHMRNCKIFYEHVLNLKELGFEINQTNVEICNKILEKKGLVDNSWLEESYLAEQQANRLHEVQVMKGFQLKEGLSLFDFLHKEPRRANLDRNNNKLVQLINNPDLESQFSTYASLIRLHYNKAVKYEEPRQKCLHCKCISLN